MKTKDVLIGLGVLVVLITGVFLLKKVKINKNLVLPSSTPSITQKIKDKFVGLTIPDDAGKTELKDVSGGESFGLATKTEILANLPDISNGQYYQGWIEKDGKLILLGTFKVAKGGWILNYDLSKYSGYSKVVVTLGSKRILEGSF